MTPRNSKPPTNRPTPGAPGVKLLISVSTLAASLGGWAVLAYNEHQALAQMPAPTATQFIEPTQTPAPNYLNVEFSSLPTVIPQPTLAKPAPTVIAPTQAAVVYVAPANSAPVVEAAPVSGLRVVDVPPPPPPSQPQQQAQSQPADQGQQQASAPPPANNAPPPVTNTQSSQG